MSPSPTESTVQERELLATARDGNEDAYRRLVEPHRSELHAHCYRMLGSVQDAEDALQEALVRAWRGLEKFEGRSSLRSWLYRIATNTSLDAIQRRPKRVLPIDYGPAADPHGGVGEPMVESVWIEPYPDETLAIEDGYASPDARYEQREAVELAFIAALQLLPANQRAVLILREVLGFSAQETADTLETSVASVNSALQRARATIEKKLPDQSQQETLSAIGDEKLREIVEQYADAWERNDVDTVVSMLADDVAFTMPPMARWFQGLDGVRDFLERWSMLPEWGWKSIPVTANGQAALAFYSWDEEQQARVPFAINVLTFEGEKIKEIDAFIVRASMDPDPDVQARTPEQPADYEKLAAAYERFGLPDRID
ncbi:MAG TPA: sigma-70 family RNA polymerase sigma factor [Solirubrobacterales bacterium]|nr:sigma-70 family RNA polymerase sigma factor [Solirubrobacterales bacterium]